MIDVNASLQTLSLVVQSGWKANAEEGRTKSSAISKVLAAVSRANEALSYLRVLCPDDLDVEHTASCYELGWVLTTKTQKRVVGVESGLAPQ
jgi:separase